MCASAAAQWNLDSWGWQQICCHPHRRTQAARIKCQGIHLTICHAVLQDKLHRPPPLPLLPHSLCAGKKSQGASTASATPGATTSTQDSNKGMVWSVALNRVKGFFPLRARHTIVSLL
jgi:hypothetical protein